MYTGPRLAPLFTACCLVGLTGCRGSDQAPAEKNTPRPAPAPAPAEPAAGATNPIPAPASAPTTASKPAAVTRAELTKGVLEALDPATQPCQDFYQYACGGWIAKNPLPADKARWTRSFNSLHDKNRELAKEVLESAAKAKDAKGDRLKLGTFYRACMDQAAVDAAGVGSVRELWTALESVTDTPSFMKALGTLHPQGIFALFGSWVGPDPKDPKTNFLEFYQAGLGLPDRDYYLDPKRKSIVDDYEKHIAKMFELFGHEPAVAAARAKDVRAFETKLASLQMSRTERRDPNKTYHKLDREGLRTQLPRLDFDAYLAAAGHPEATSINVESVRYLTGAATLLAKTKPETLVAYLQWSVAASTADHLSSAIADTNFAFFGTQLNGQKENEARWKRCASWADEAMGMELGRDYVERAFFGDSKGIALDLIGRIETAFEQGLPGLSWMDDETRAKAIEKMKAIRNKIGYPDTWRTYDTLTVADVDHVGNVLRARAFEYHRKLAMVGKPVDAAEWEWSPPTVNASYSGTRNEMLFPAGILQPPFFHSEAPMAMNFGGIGMVMGHELVHGFDDQGRKFDGTGMLKEWWPKAVASRFETRAKCVDDLYSTFPVEDLHVNGKLTLGENIADLGGLRQAIRGYRAWAKDHGGDTTPHVEGLTNEQLVFVNFAQIWCTNETPESAKQRVATDPHSPAKYRVNGPVSHLSEFSAAFGCAEGTPMRAARPCEVW